MINVMKHNGDGLDAPILTIFNEMRPIVEVRRHSLQFFPVATSRLSIAGIARGLTFLILTKSEDLHQDPSLLLLPVCRS